MTAETPAVDLDAIRALLAQPSPSNLQYGWGVSVTIARALLGMVDTLTAALTAIAEGKDPRGEAFTWRSALLNVEAFARAALAGTSPAPPTRDLAALADQWEAQRKEWLVAAEDAEAEGRTEAANFNRGAALALADQAAELRAALGVPRSPSSADLTLANLVNEQAEDEGLWFIATSATEGYLQQELRRLHAAVEAALGVLRSAGHEEDPVRTATPGTSNQ